MTIETLNLIGLIGKTIHLPELEITEAYIDSVVVEKDTQYQPAELNNLTGEYTSERLGEYGDIIVRIKVLRRYRDE